MAIKNCKVLILYFSSTVVCGIGTWIEMLSKVLQQKKIDVVIGLTWGNTFHNPKIVESARPNLSTVRMDGRTGTKEGRIQAIEKTVKRVRPDIVIIANINEGFEAVRRLKYSGLKIRLIATNHGNLAKQAASFISNQDVIDLAVCVSKLSYSVIQNSQITFPNERLRCIPHGVEGSKSAFAVKIPFRKLHIGYAGRLDSDKNPLKLIRFFEELNDKERKFSLWIAGDGQYAHEIKALSEKYPETLKYWGSLSRDRIYEDFYPYLDIFVNFSPSEGWGFSIAEAMAHGVVPVSSAFRGIHQDGLIIDNINGLLFSPDDIHGCVSIIRQLERDRELLKELSDNALKTAGKFTLERFTERWIKALNDCLHFPEKTIRTKPKSLNVKGRFGLSERLIEKGRRLLRRRVTHSSQRGEWPSYKCEDKSILAAVTAAFEQEESRHAR